MARIDLLRTTDHALWTEVLGQAAEHDFYHLPEYHGLAEERGEGSARLFVYSDDGYTLALPLLLRTLEDVPGIEGSRCTDATSVYGYAGPVASHRAIPDSLRRGFQAELRTWLDAAGVVAAFSRLHPLTTHEALLAGVGECLPVAQTVSIDLTLPVQGQRAHYRKNHKEGINRLRRLGVSCLHDQAGSHLQEFVALYHETMQRVHATASYFFPVSYFQDLERRLASRLHLFVCTLEGQVISGGLFVECAGILQYHLGGTRSDFLKLAPMKLLVDDVRLWAVARGLRVFHLGGGATPRADDSLLHFKRGFSPRTHEFAVWRWVLSPDTYARLCREKAAFNERHRLRCTTAGFFPEYRCPTVPVESLVAAPPD